MNLTPDDADPFKLVPEENIEVPGIYGPKTRRVPNHIYFVQCGDYVKIGIAADVRKRVRDMEMGNPHVLTILHVMAGKRQEERKLHERFKRYRHRDEWFRFEGELRRYVEGLQNDNAS